MKGLLLEGGRSSRMGKDKASLILRDELSQHERGLQLLGTVCDAAFTSSREASIGAITDIRENAGPLAGLEAALAEDPASPWLLLACDLPLMETCVLETLRAAYDETPLAFRNRSDGRAEPLCAIYPPDCRRPLQEWLDAGKFCARHFLESLSPRLLDLPEGHPFALDNANTPEDLIELEYRLAGSPTEKRLSLLHFAQLRDQIGSAEQSHTTTCATAAGVFDEIRMAHSLKLKRTGLKVAVNGEFSSWDHLIADGDELVFIPPVSGG